MRKLITRWVKDETIPKKMQAIPFAGKVMAIVSWDSYRVILVVYL